MLEKLRSKLKMLAKALLALGLVGTLVFGQAHDALAARGGRIGGGSFRAPSRSVSPSRGGGYSSPGYGYGGGIGFPFVIPFFFGGGGGLFSILIFLAIAGFLVRSFRSFGAVDENGMAIEGNYGTVSVAKVQVGLLSSARYLQKDLNELALTADTGTPEGRVEVLQESTLALLRHPEYWVYGAADEKQTSLSGAETTFNQWSLDERGKLTGETLSNYNSQIRQSPDALPSAGGELAETGMDDGEYILVTVLVGTVGKLQLPKINNSDDLKRAVQMIGSVGIDRLLAIEVIWTPQADGDILTKDDIIANYPDLKIV
ncbi:DUF1517 domain-containing protein [Pannus brasiliensis CCIBt3594]|uniref:DUF1517 domain-containing protein n=1 Tax=Pannus brasiliensis CCIBt3594 TaxID=1427578 RepID=A0AAW9R072_9CHRO